jgi:hypothetical protein
MYYKLRRAGVGTELGTSAPYSTLHRDFVLVQYRINGCSQLNNVLQSTRAVCNSALCILSSEDQGPRRVL